MKLELFPFCFPVLPSQPGGVADEDEVSLESKVYSHPTLLITSD